MKTYRLDPEKLPKQKQTIYLMYGVTLVVMVVLIYFLNRGRETLATAMFLTLLIAGVYVFTGLRSVRQREELWETYSLTVDDAGLTQTQPKYPDVFIRRGDITRVEEVKNGLIIYTRQGGRTLGIDRNLTEADFEEIKATLNSWVASPVAEVIDIPSADVHDLPETDIEETEIEEILPPKDNEGGSL